MRETNRLYKFLMYDMKLPEFETDKATNLWAAQVFEAERIPAVAPCSAACHTLLCQNAHSSSIDPASVRPRRAEV
jgi:hypothetical protein